jgi:hypothetical protein
MLGAQADSAWQGGPRHDKKNEFAEYGDVRENIPECETNSYSRHQGSKYHTIYHAGFNFEKNRKCRAL